MKNLQRAINYESILKALNKSDSAVMPIFEKTKEWCGVDSPLLDNMVAYSYVSCASERDLVAAYNEVSDAFMRLDENVEIIDHEDPLWPKDVTEYEFLYLKGKKELLNRPGLSIVGTRLPSQKGIERTVNVVDAVGKDFVIISGLAKGIDGAAHLQALKNDFGTIAVIGTNIADYYPPEHRKLQDIIAQVGLVVSPFAPSRKTENYFFMNRNRVMSEIAKGSLIAESADSGGGVKQAFFSEKQEKPVFIFKDDFNDSSLRWPKEFENPVVIEAASDIIPYLKGDKEPPKLQPSLL